MTTAGLLDGKEAAALLGLSPKTLEKWRSMGLRAPGLPFVRLGSAIKYRECDIQKFIKDNVVGGTQEKPKRRTKKSA